MYRVATFLLKEWWGQYPEMTDALTVLPLTWNSAFYRYGSFDERRLEAFLRGYWDTIDSFRNRDLLSFSQADHPKVTELFRALLDALQISEGKSRGRKSPVGAAKALHLLAPAFFPLWDGAIALHYGCFYAADPPGAYFRFCGLIRDIAVDLSQKLSNSPKSILKRIDEFNYAKYTKNWI